VKVNIIDSSAVRAAAYSRRTVAAVCGPKIEAALADYLSSASFTNTLACMETPSGQLAQNARSCTKSAQIAGPKSHRALAQRLLSDR
jgi:hypothetical protein